MDFYADDSLKYTKTRPYLAYCHICSWLDYPLYLASFHDFLVNCCAFALEFCAHWRIKTQSYSLWKTNQACHAGIRILYLCAGYLVCFLLRFDCSRRGSQFLVERLLEPARCYFARSWYGLYWTVVRRWRACFSTTDTFNLRACRRCMDV